MISVCPRTKRSEAWFPSVLLSDFRPIGRQYQNCSLCIIFDALCFCDHRYAFVSLIHGLKLYHEFDCFQSVAYSFLIVFNDSFNEI